VVEAAQYHSWSMKKGALMSDGRWEKHWGLSIFHLTFAMQDAFFSILHGRTANPSTPL
jgi:hypothetical protein